MANGNLGSDLFRGPSDQLSVCLLPLKMDHPGVVLVMGDLDGPWNSMVHSINDCLLVSMVKDTDGPAIWSDGPRNKYDPGFRSYQKPTSRRN